MTPAELLRSRARQQALLRYRSRAPEIALIGLAVAAAWIGILVGIGRPIWHDDANAVLMARQDFSGMWNALRQDNNLPAYYVLLWAWIRAFGESEPALRSLSALFYLAGAGIVAGLAFAMFRSRRAALYSAVLYAASTQLTAQAQSVRMYTLLGFLSAASMWLFVSIFREGPFSDPPPASEPAPFGSGGWPW